MIATFVQPDYTTQTAAEYKAAIDAAMAVLKRLAAPFAAHQQNVGSPAPDLSIRVDAGQLFIGTTLTEIAAQTVSGFTIPAAGQERYDRVVVNSSTGVATRIAGTASTGSPSAGLPAITTGNLPCCYVKITSADTVITDSMITDERAAAIGGATITLGSPVTATSGTSIDFTSIPANTKRIVIAFAGLSTNGSDTIVCQIGDSGGVETSGYLGSCGASLSTATNFTASFGVDLYNTSTGIRHGAIELFLIDSANNTWVCMSHTRESIDGFVYLGGGSKSLSAMLDRVRVTTISGVNTFDAGIINVQYFA